MRCPRLINIDYFTTLLAYTMCKSVHYPIVYLYIDSSEIKITTTTVQFFPD